LWELSVRLIPCLCRLWPCRVRGRSLRPRTYTPVRRPRWA
jgi:hypothetical protein